MPKAASLAVLILILGSPMASGGDAGALRALLSSEQITFTGVTPGGDVVLLGLAVFTESGVPTRIHVAEMLSDTPGAGAVTYKPGGGVPFRSLWFAADLASGSVGFATPQGFEPDHREIAPASIKKDADGLIAALEMERLTVEMLLIRPKEGAWLLRAREGSPSDGDRARDGRLTLLFDQAEPLGARKDKAPRRLKAGDVVVVLDPGRLELRTLTVTQR